MVAKKVATSAGLKAARTKRRNKVRLTAIARRAVNTRVAKAAVRSAVARRAVRSRSN